MLAEISWKFERNALLGHWRQDGMVTPTCTVCHWASGNPHILLLKGGSIVADNFLWESISCEQVGKDTDSSCYISASHRSCHLRPFRVRIYQDKVVFPFRSDKINVDSLPRARGPCPWAEGCCRWCVPCLGTLQACMGNLLKIGI